MSKKEKLIERLKTNPKDFTFNETKTLMGLYGYEISSAGKSSGSQVHFTKGKKVFYMHKPHPRKELLVYQVKAVRNELEQEGLI